MAGIDWLNGKSLEGWPHVVQSLQVLFTTPIGSRVMRRIYGAVAGRLLGQPIVPALLSNFRMTIVTACELWEPRFVIRAGLVLEGNSPETLRLGHLVGLELRGEYRPRAHLGDPTPEGHERRVYIGFGQSTVEVVG